MCYAAVLTLCVQSSVEWLAIITNKKVGFINAVKLEESKKPFM